MAKIKICLDAGHYGKYNRSPAVKEYYESDMNWKLHNMLKKYLEEYGFEVIQTRANQATDLELTARGKKAKGCDLFLSIHSNAVGSYVNEDIDYPAIYHLTDDTTTDIDEKSKALASKFAKLIAETMQTKQEGRISSRKSSNDRNKDGFMNDNYYGVLHGARVVGVPGLILEHSFHTNTRATQWLLNDANLEKMAKAEADLLAEYYGVEIQKKPVVKEYQVIVELPTYNSAAEAKAKTNKIGTFAPGTYYIYTKYPDGYDGMLNISKNSSGASAGAWINPEENVKPKAKPVLREGSKGESVRLLQSTLSVLGYKLGGIDGIFGERTEKAVKAFQKDNDLADDGVCGPKTWAALGEAKYYTVEVTASALNIREGAGTKYGIKGIANKGQKLIIVSAQGNWGRIINSGGWISLNYAKRV